jgi:hypothetical protein
MPAASADSPEKSLLNIQTAACKRTRSSQPASQPIEIQSVQENNFPPEGKSQRQSLHREFRSRNPGDYLGHGRKRDEDNILTLAHKLFTGGGWT